MLRLFPRIVLFDHAYYFLESIWVEVFVACSGNYGVLLVEHLKLEVGLEYQMGPLDLLEAHKTEQKMFPVV